MLSNSKLLIYFYAANLKNFILAFPVIRNCNSSCYIHVVVEHGNTGQSAVSVFTMVMLTRYCLAEPCRYKV